MVSRLSIHYGYQGAVLVKMLNNHFRSYREFNPRRFKVVINDVDVRV